MSTKPPKIEARLSYNKLLVVTILTTVILLIYGYIFLSYYAFAKDNHGGSSDDVAVQLFKPVGKSVDENLLSEEKPASSAIPEKPVAYIIPTMLYHKTPDNFEEQLIVLRDRGYTTITMSELNNIVRGKAQLPAKPIAITFDDGFTDQLRAFELLKKYNMKSTFYIITGGERSGWCIGADRRSSNCGDSYLNWEQIKKIHDSGLVEIGSHTINHLSLPGLSYAVAREEIIKSKDIIEEKMGIKVTSFAYPYGRLDSSLMAIVQEAGYLNATGTSEGDVISIDNIYNIPRLRSTLKLP